MANVLQTKQVDAQCDKETAGGAGGLTTNQRGYNNNGLHGDGLWRKLTGLSHRLIASHFKCDFPYYIAADTVSTDLERRAVPLR